MVGTWGGLPMWDGVMGSIEWFVVVVRVVMCLWTSIHRLWRCFVRCLGGCSFVRVFPRTFLYVLFVQRVSSCRIRDKIPYALVRFLDIRF